MFSIIVHIYFQRYMNLGSESAYNYVLLNFNTRKLIVSRHEFIASGRLQGLQKKKHLYLYPSHRTSFFIVSRSVNSQIEAKNTTSGHHFLLLTYKWPANFSGKTNPTCLWDEKLNPVYFSAEDLIAIVCCKKKYLVSLHRKCNWNYQSNLMWHTVHNYRVVRLATATDIARAFSFTEKLRTSPEF